VAETEAGQECVRRADVLAEAGALGAFVADQLEIANLPFPELPPRYSISRGCWLRNSLGSLAGRSLGFTASRYFTWSGY
jgi:hypothetical protein